MENMTCITSKTKGVVAFFPSLLMVSFKILGKVMANLTKIMQRQLLTVSHHWIFFFFSLLLWVVESVTGYLL